MKTGIGETCRFDEISEVCKSIELKSSTCLQSATSVKPLYDHAVIATSLFQEAVRPYKDIVLLDSEVHPGDKHPHEAPVDIDFGAMKKLPRLLQKLLSRSIQCAAIMDVVRGMIVCKSNITICKVLKLLARDKKFIIHRVKDGYSSFQPGEWVDVKVIVSMTDDINEHKCELQIVHKKMVVARQSMGGHEAYSKYRSLRESIEAISREEQGAEEFEAFLAKFRQIVAQKNSKRIKQLAAAFNEKLMENFKKTAKLESEIGKLEATLPDLVLERKFTECQDVEDKIKKLRQESNDAEENDPDDPDHHWGTTFGNPPKFLLRDEFGKLSLESDLSYLNQYPYIPLSEYKDDGNFWHINKNFPNLRAIHRSGTLPPLISFRFLCIPFVMPLPPPSPSTSETHGSSWRPTF
jgi:hypothetical protein